MSKSPFIKVPLTTDKDGVFMVLESSDEATKKDQLLAKRESQNRLVVQQIYLISLLTQNGFDVLLDKPHKKSTVSLQTLPIHSIRYNNEVLWNTDTLKLDRQTAKERKVYIETLTNNLMITLLKQTGVDIRERQTRRGTKTSFIQLKRVDSLICGGFVLDLTSITQHARVLYNYLQENMTKDGILIAKFDKKIKELLMPAFTPLLNESLFKPCLKQIVMDEYSSELTSDSSCVC
ncbi:hypothetical protein EIN_034150 [Entamoeba invadens IP1]|uniref:Uncharacterized protein n=1 Tax=Entamoeba invadens IP1 TaxID=370355 RepID=A0A0A1TYF5_ENTIV|nr:hypothetical protein EIN_034150 [Entamoeba invadens IP1]ELP86504.1 hypothetical protein EIN_034150 [Entamoeba invadens IP1]|eukprot:XP_004185850.1 hypothetical protein EIN_034150 [Entamoeba invadens IP1]